MAPTQVQLIIDRLDELEHNLVARIADRVSALELVNAEERGAANERARQGTNRMAGLTVLAGLAGSISGALIYIVGTALFGSAHP